MPGPYRSEEVHWWPISDPHSADGLTIKEDGDLSRSKDIRAEECAKEEESTTPDKEEGRGKWKKISNK
jgi:hypothetical protein